MINTALYSAPDVRWSSVQWQPMPPPQNTWVLLQSEGADGEELIGSGYIHGDRSWASTSYDGNPQASVTDHLPLSMFEGWAPIVTPAPPAAPEGPVRCCPFCGSIEFLRDLESWHAISLLDEGNYHDLQEWQCHSEVCGGRSFWA
jgi:hypothetical protein